MTAAGYEQAVDTATVTEFYHREAGHLDDNELQAWLALLTPDLAYRVPVRAVRERGLTADGSDFTDRAHFLWEDIGTLRTRVRRLESEFAWAERPPTRTRRLVSNLRRGVPGGDGSESGVRTNIAVYCYRGTSPTPVVLTGQRTDTLRLVDGELRIADRLVHLDSTVLGLHALSIFL